MKEIIKFCNHSEKLVNKILVIETDEHTLCLHLMKIYGEIEITFPLEIVEDYTILQEKSEKFESTLKDFDQYHVIKLTFTEQLNWEEMILVFLNKESFEQFEKIYINFRENQILQKKKFSLQTNKSKIQNTYKEKKNTIHSKPNPNASPKPKNSLLQDIYHNTFKMNALMEHYSKPFLFPFIFRKIS